MATNKKFSRGDFVFIEWGDACSQDDWIDQDEVILGPTPVVSVGIVVSRNKESITIATNHNPENESFSCLMCIPVGMIYKIRKLK